MRLWYNSPVQIERWDGEIGMKYNLRVMLLVMLDCIFVGSSVVSSYYIRYNGNVPVELWGEIVSFSMTAVLALGLSFYYFKMYHRAWRYASIGEIIAVVKATLIGIAVAYLATLLMMRQVVDFPVLTRTFQTILILVGGSRFAWRIFRDTYFVKNHRKKKPALLIGAGDGGASIARELKNNPASEVYPVAFIDDDPKKKGLQVQGIQVLGGRELIQASVEKYHVEEIIIAMPSISKNQISEVIEVCKGTGVRLKILPALSEILAGKVSLSSIRDVQVEDLLGRDPVTVDLAGITDYIRGKVVLVTGAGGSIGSELCRQIAYFQPSKLLLLGHGENSIYQIESELLRLKVFCPIETIIADIQDRKRLDTIFKHFRPQVVFHAAAHKHVPLMERNPSESIKNNVFGTRNVAEYADLYGAERFVLISSDKAVNPTSIMGVTKRIAEMVIQCMNVHSKTKFSAVRFGNVLGSRGSVIPRFKEQIAAGGPVTVTHPDMVRYFMTIPEAVQLVIQAGAYAEGGEVFILDMGKPVKIVTLAEDLIRFSGLEPHVDVKIEFTGIRPGEKLFEELLTDEEGLTSTKHNRIFIGRPSNISRTEMDFELKRLEQVLGEDQQSIRALLKTIVPTYGNVS